MNMSNPEGLLRLPQVLAQFPVSRAAWYLGVKEGRYPRQVRLGARAVAWRQVDIVRLISSLSTIDPMLPE